MTQREVYRFAHVPESPDRPKKPAPTSPDTARLGHSENKVRGRIYYFGKWARRVDRKLRRTHGGGREDAPPDRRILRFMRFVRGVRSVREAGPAGPDPG